MMFRRFSFRLPVVALIVGLCLLVASCVELIGQRFIVHYDRGADVLEVLIFYDGVHRNREQKSVEESAEQVRQFIQKGNVMLLDWWGHIEVADLAEMAGDEELSDPQRAVLAHLSQHMRVEAVGHARSGPGQVSGVQRVTIGRFSELIEALNRLLDETFTDLAQEPPKPLQRTMRLWQQAADDGHRWLRLDGQAIAFHAPVDRREWAMARSDLLDSLVDDLKRVTHDAEQFEQVERDLRLAVTFLANVPLTYSDRDGELRLSLGHSRSANTYPFRIREEGRYNEDLEQVIQEVAPLDVTRKLALGALKPDAHSPAGAVAMLAEHGPVELKIRGLIGLVEAEDEHAAAAAEMLDDFAARWNQQRKSPAAPDPQPRQDQAREAWLEQWREWAATVELFPQPAGD